VKIIATLAFPYRRRVGEKFLKVQNTLTVNFRSLGPIEQSTVPFKKVTLTTMASLRLADINVTRQKVVLVFTCYEELT
jgi:hypothetical protein